MLPSILIIGAVFIGVVTLIIGAAVFFRDKSELQVEDRLSSLTGKGELTESSSLSQIAQVIAKQNEGKGCSKTWSQTGLIFADCLSKLTCTMSVSSFLGLCVGIGVGASALCGSCRIALGTCPCGRTQL